MKFNEKIVVLRKIKGITQDELASAVGVSRQAVYKWECGQSYPEVAKLIELKLLFNISIDDLLDENYVITLPEKKKRIPRAQKAAIENKVKEELVKETVTPAEAVEEPVIEEPIKVSAQVSAKETEVKAETASAITEETKETEDSQAPEATEKKKGFFGRLFGRK